MRKWHTINFTKRDRHILQFIKDIYGNYSLSASFMRSYNTDHCAMGRVNVLRAREIKAGLVCCA